jgi:hypothetical protein
VDGNGTQYDSYYEMWQQRMKNRPSESKTKESLETTSTCASLAVRANWYDQSEQYWRQVEPTVDGMLGGLAHVSEAVRFVRFFFCLWFSLCCFVSGSLHVGCERIRCFLERTHTR